MYLSASSTVEASLVLPVFIYAVMTFVYLIQIAGLQIKMQQAIYNESRKMAKFAYACEKIRNEFDKNQTEDLTGLYEGGEDPQCRSLVANGISIGVAEAMLISELGPDYMENSNIIGGAAGVSFIASEFMTNDNMIDIVVTYAVKNPFDIFGIGIMTFTQRARSCAWVGDSYKARDSSETGYSEAENGELQVYITKNGNVYHTNRYCAYLNLSVHPVMADQMDMERNKSGSRYYPCEKCGNKIIGNELYVTDYGESYHTTKNCSSLVRNVIKVPLSEVADRRVCAKCKGGSSE